MADRREKARQTFKKTNAFELAKQQKENKGGDSTAVALPDGWEFFRPEPGTYRLDVLNYVVGDDHNKWADKGYLLYECEFGQHWVPSIDGKSRPYVCLVHWGKRCPLCERYARPKEDDTEEFVRELRAKTMHLMLVKLLSKDDVELKNEKFRVWVANEYNKGKGLFEQLRALIRRKEKYGEFAYWESGLSLEATFEEVKWPGGVMIQAERLDFVERENQYDPDELLPRLCCLDELLIQKNYQQLRSVLENGVEDPDDGRMDSIPFDPKGAARGAPKKDAKEPAKEPARQPTREPARPTEEPKETTTEPELEALDWVLHARLGRCRVREVKNGKVVLEDNAGRVHKNVPAKECDPLAEPGGESEPDDREDNDEPDEPGRTAFSEWGDGEEPEPEEKPKTVKPKKK